MTGDAQSGEIRRLPPGQPGTQRFDALAGKRAVCLVHVFPSESKPAQRPGRGESRLTQPGMCRTVFAVDGRHGDTSRLLKKLTEDAGAVSMVSIGFKPPRCCGF